MKRKPEGPAGTAIDEKKGKKGQILATTICTDQGIELSYR